MGSLGSTQARCARSALPGRDRGALNGKHIVGDTVCHANGLGLSGNLPSLQKEGLSWMSPELHGTKKQEGTCLYMTNSDKEEISSQKRGGGDRAGLG